MALLLACRPYYTCSISNNLKVKRHVRNFTVNKFYFPICSGARFALHFVFAPTNLLSEDYWLRDWALALPTTQSRGALLRTHISGLQPVGNSGVFGPQGGPSVVLDQTSGRAARPHLCIVRNCLSLMYCIFLKIYYGIKYEDKWLLCKLRAP